ncbi:MAG: hypothetical protein LQ337_006683 [Flavoplaca oasis]|nr:MAG: hypothetical protein LQ337_006683 [Flavoplaca oasis]
MTICIWSINSSLFKDCLSSNCKSLGCVSIPCAFTPRVHEFVIQAIKALDSAWDFSWEQRMGIHRLYTDIHTAMKIVPIHLSIPNTPPLLADITECKGTSGTPFVTYAETETNAAGSQTNHFQSITFMQMLGKGYSFEEVRLADYKEDRRYRDGDWQVFASSSLSSTVRDTLTKMSHRLASAEEAISRLQSENATLKMSAVTSMDLLLVQQDLDRLRSQISTSEYDVKKRKTFSPAWSLPPQSPGSNFFASAAISAPHTATAATLASKSSPFGLPPESTPGTNAPLSAPAPNTASQFIPASSGSFFGQGVKPFQLTPYSDTASNVATTSPASNTFSGFSAAPNAFATTAASTTPSTFNFNPKTPSLPVTPISPTVNLFAHSEDTLPLTQASSGPKAVPTSMAPTPTNSTSSNAFPAFGGFAFGGLTPQASQPASQFNSLTETDLKS